MEIRPQFMDIGVEVTRASTFLSYTQRRVFLSVEICFIFSVFFKRINTRGTECVYQARIIIVVFRFTGATPFLSMCVRARARAFDESYYIIIVGPGVPLCAPSFFFYSVTKKKRFLHPFTIIGQYPPFDSATTCLRAHDSLAYVRTDVSDTTDAAAVVENAVI